MPLVPFTAGSRLTAATLNAALDVNRTVIQTADQFKTADTVLVNSTTLTLPVVTNAWYDFSATLFYTASTVGDFKLNVAMPSGAAIVIGTWCATASVTATNTTIAVDALTVPSYNAGGLGTGTIMTLRPTGAILTGATAGSITIQFAQAASDAATTTLKAGSTMRLIKVI